MTVLLCILNSNPDDKVTVSYNGSAAAMRAIDSEATVISLQEGEELTMQDLLFGTLKVLRCHMPKCRCRPQ